MTLDHKAGIILCGGLSKRMGRAKATLPFGDELMLPRVARLLIPVVDHLVVVAAANQELPALPRDVTVVRDRHAGHGPLEGLAAGLTALDDKTAAAFATSCDVPLLVPAFVRRMFELLEDHEIAVPYDGKFHHPLAAVYRRSVLEHVQYLLDEGRLRPFFLFEKAKTRLVTPEEWHDVDPQSMSLANLNRPDDYLRALAAAGLDVDPEIARKLSGSSSPGDD